MRLTGHHEHVAHREKRAQPEPFVTRWLALVIASLLLVFFLDHRTGSAPVQHLYYLPIVIAAVRLDRRAGLITALVAVLAYHLANPALLSTRYKESDLVQIALFIGVGVVADKFTHDARRLRRLASTDDLTGLYNLRGFEARLATVVGAARQAGTPVSLLVFDVDRLKSLNDTYGHLAGADAVREVGLVVGSCFEDDAVACRFGGDEFVVALPGRDVGEACEAAEELRRAVSTSAPVLAGIAFPAETLSVSIGVACLSWDDDPVDGWPAGDPEAGEALFRAADSALYAAKATGRNRVSANPLQSLEPRLG